MIAKSSELKVPADTEGLPSPPSVTKSLFLYKLLDLASLFLGGLRRLTLVRKFEN